MRLVIIIFISMVMSIEFHGQITVTSIDDGNWSSGATWDSNAQPSPGDFVIIDHNVTLDVDVLPANAVGSVTINNNTANKLGALTIGTRTLSTTGNFSLLGFSVGWGTVFLGIGVLNVGGGFIFNKGSFNISGGTINIAEFYSHINGTMTNSANVEINVSSNGPRNDNTDPSIFYGINAIVTLNSSNVSLNLNDLNTGTAPEIYSFDFTTTGTGSVTVDIKNTSNISNDNCHIISDADFETLELNLNNDIATGNEIICETINAGIDFTIADLNLSNGLMSTVAPTNLAITNSLSLNSTAELTVNGNFTSTATNVLSVDGILYTTGNLILQSSNISGGGTVYAGIYVVGTNLVYGIPQVNLTSNSYFSASTWFGSISNDWFVGGNWQTGSAPLESTDVTIWSGALNFPEINVDGTGAKTKNFIISSGASVKINSGGNLASSGIQMINNSAGNFTIIGGTYIFTGSQMINHSSSVLTIDGGTLNYSGIKFINSATGIINIINEGQLNTTVSDKLDNQGQITINNSQMNVTGDLNMQSGSTLDIQNGSSVQVEQ